MTDQELITKLQGLKQIKPQTNWVLLTKTRVLESKNAPVITPSLNRRFFGALNALHQPRFAYALAAVAVVVLAAAGLTQFGAFNMKLSQTTANLADQVALKSDVEEFKTNTQNLAAAVKSNPKSTEVVLKQVKDAAKKLTDQLHKNPELAKSIALEVNNNNSLLYVPGGTQISEVADAYQALDAQLIKDDEKVTFTPEKEAEYLAIKDSFNSKTKDFTTILRDLLVLSASQSSGS